MIMLDTDIVSIMTTIIRRAMQVIGRKKVTHTTAPQSYKNANTPKSHPRNLLPMSHRPNEKRTRAR